MLYAGLRFAEDDVHHAQPYNAAYKRTTFSIFDLFKRVTRTHISNICSNLVGMTTVPPLDPRERARLNSLARVLASIVARGVRLDVRRERSARGEYLEHAIDRALLAEYRAARQRIHWIDPKAPTMAQLQARQRDAQQLDASGEHWHHEPP